VPTSLHPAALPPISSSCAKRFHCSSWQRPPARAHAPPVSASAACDPWRTGCVHPIPTPICVLVPPLMTTHPRRRPGHLLCVFISVRSSCAGDLQRPARTTTRPSAGRADAPPGRLQPPCGWLNGARLHRRVRREGARLPLPCRTCMSLAVRHPASHPLATWSPHPSDALLFLGCFERLFVTPSCQSTALPSPHRW